MASYRRSLSRPGCARTLELLAKEDEGVLGYAPRSIFSILFFSAMALVGQQQHLYTVSVACRRSEACIVCEAPRNKSNWCLGFSDVLLVIHGYDCLIAKLAYWPVATSQDKAIMRCKNWSLAKR